MRRANFSKMWVCADASFAPTGDASHEGMCLIHGGTSEDIFHGNLIHWKSNKQTLVTKSSCEAELLALVSAADRLQVPHDYNIIIIISKSALGLLQSQLEHESLICLRQASYTSSSSQRPLAPWEVACAHLRSGPLSGSCTWPHGEAPASPDPQMLSGSALRPPDRKVDSPPSGPLPVNRDTRTKTSWPLRSPQH
eukprot:6263352-Amphidinium_carterae.2